MDDSTIECKELSVEVNIDPDTVYSLDFDHQMPEGAEILYMGHSYIITTVEALPGRGWRAWVRLAEKWEADLLANERAQSATKNPV